MLEKEILTQILEQYEEEHKPKKTAAKGIQDFCAYATKWFSNRGVIGVGHTTDGIALRFADGRELLLCRTTPTNPDMGAAVSLSGAGGSVRSAGAIADNSVSITNTNTR